MEYLTFAESVPSSAIVASTRTRCDDGKGMLLGTSSNRLMSLTGLSRSAGLPRILEAIIPKGATSTEGSSQNVRGPARATRSTLVKIVGTAGPCSERRPGTTKEVFVPRATDAAKADNSPHFSSAMAYPEDKITTIALPIGVIFCDTKS